MTATVLLLSAAAVALVLIVAIVVLAVRARRSSAPRALPGAAGPRSPNAVVCSFCKREYDPGTSGGHCPGCGAATPRRR